MDIYEQMDAASANGQTITTDAPPPNAAPIVPIRQGTQQKRLDLPDETPATPPAPGNTPPPPQPPATTFNEETFFTEKSGGKFKTWDEVQAELGKKPEVIKEPFVPTFPNEVSKQVYELASSGKIDDLFPVLEKRNFAMKVKDLDDDSILIADIKRQYPSLANDDVKAKRQFDRMYGVDETKFPSDVDLEIEKMMVGDRKKADAAKARQTFSAIEDIKIPQVASQQPQVPELTESAKAAMTLGKSYTSTDVSKLPFQFAPQNSPFKVEGQITLPSDKVNDLSNQISANPEAFIAGFITERWFKDQKPNAAAIAQDMVLLQNLHDIMGQVSEKTANEVLIQKHRQDKNISDQGTAHGHLDLTPSEDDAWDKFFGIPGDKRVAV